MPVAIVEPAPGDLGTGDRFAVRIRLARIARLHHQIERHRQARCGLAAIRPAVETCETVDQPDLAAGLVRHIGTVHAVHDPGQHESRIARFQVGEVEQLHVEALADADGLGRICRLVPRDVAVEFRIDRRRNRFQLGQRREHQVGRERDVRVPLRREQTRDRQRIVLVELAQEIGIGDRSAARQRSSLRRE